MNGGGLEARVEFYGMSPWEVEVVHGYLGAMFALDEAEVGKPADDIVSYMRIAFPVVFSDAFFGWFGAKRWDRIKMLFKEMKRRRGGRPGSLVIRLDFVGAPAVSFVIDSDGRAGFDNSVEKLDYVLEVLEQHLEARAERPLVYRFNGSTRRWALDVPAHRPADRGTDSRKTI